jgi:hypothetical protein
MTVRQHRSSTGRHWRKGVFLHYPIEIYNSWALLELADDLHLWLDVRAPSPDLQFTVLRDSLEDLINSRWPGLKYEFLVPCTRLHGEPLGRCGGMYKLGNLMRFRERGISEIDCIECGRKNDISEMLTGFGLAMPATEIAIRVMSSQLEEVHRDLQRLHADSALSLRRVLRAIARDVSDCPRLFTVRKVEPRGRERLKPHEIIFEFTLWCEYPDQWHPSSAIYRIPKARGWFAKIAPYASLVFKTLKGLAPIGSAILGVTDPNTAKDAEARLKLMDEILKTTPTQYSVGAHGGHSFSPQDSLMPSEGESLRIFRHLMLMVDPARAFGDLRLVPSVEDGQMLWVCTRHYKLLDPGLPTL